MALLLLQETSVTSYSYREKQAGVGFIPIRWRSETTVTLPFDTTTTPTGTWTTTTTTPPTPPPTGSLQVCKSSDSCKRVSCTPYYKIIWGASWLCGYSIK